MGTFRSLSLKCVGVRILEPDAASRPGSTSLHAGLAFKDNHEVLAKLASNFGLAYAQTFTCCHHQHDGNDAPGNTEHGEGGAQLVCPDGAEYIDDQVAEDHASGFYLW